MVAYPINRISNIRLPVGTPIKKKSPATSVTSPSVVPRTDTVAPGSASPVDLSLTVPITAPTSPLWAKANEGKIKISSRILFIYIVFIN
jgi:hypothetical protein